jgi:hypothetical protein
MRQQDQAVVEENAPRQVATSRPDSGSDDAGPALLTFLGL